MVIGQVAVASILLVGGLLLGGSFLRLTGEHLGFEPRSVLTAKLPAAGLGETQTRKNQTIAEILERLERLPHVEAVGMTSVLPLNGHGFYFVVPLEGGEPPPPDPRDGYGVDVLSRGCLRALGTRLVAGRDFRDSDRENSPAVAIVNSAFARLHWGEEAIVGRRLGLGGTPRTANITIVGVAEDVRDGHPSEPVRPKVYIPYTQAAPRLGWHTAVLILKPTSDDGVLAEIVRRAVAEVAPRAIVYDVKRMETRLSAVVAPHRQRAVLFAVLAGLAVGLAAVGLFGLISYVVARDLHEFGLRLALGARRRDLLMLVLRRGVSPAAVGLAFGLTAALPVNRTLANLLYGVAPSDPRTFLIAAGTMLVVSVVASLGPAHRAVNADPLIMIRGE